MRKILVPIDGSRSSENAIEYVLERKKRRERLKVCILYVQPTPLIMSKEVEQLLLEQQQKVFSERRIKAALKKLGVKPNFLIGDPAHSIIKFASLEGVDEIVMGTRGLGRLAGVLVGSVTSKVIHMATVPVTLIK